MKYDLEKIVLEALKEDTSFKDITSEVLFDSKQVSEFELIINEDAVLSGLDLFKASFLLIDKNVEFQNESSDGNFVKKSSTILHIFGSTLTVLKAERTALNFLSHLSGIATKSKELVDKIRHTGVILLDTRKTTPGLRVYEKRAIFHGGAQNHRFNLSEMVLIKDNHITVFGSIKDLLLKVKGKYGNKYKVEVEVSNLAELKEVLPLVPDIIMFDNWLPKDLKEAVKLVPHYILTEASGQINLENVLDYATAGVNYISTGYMIKNAKWIDFSLEATKSSAKKC